MLLIEIAFQNASRNDHLFCYPTGTDQPYKTDRPTGILKVVRRKVPGDRLASVFLLLLSPLKSVQRKPGTIMV